MLLKILCKAAMTATLVAPMLVAHDAFELPLAQYACLGCLKLRLGESPGIA